MICIFDGGEAMCNDDGCSVMGYLVEGGLDSSFTADVNRTSSFIQYENIGLLDNGSSDGKTLPLAPGESSSAVTDACIIALPPVSIESTKQAPVTWQGKFVNKLISESLLAGFLHKFSLLLFGLSIPGRPDQSPSDVPVDCVVEQEGLLLNKPDF